jgi:hypothetical protein
MLRPGEIFEKDRHIADLEGELNKPAIVYNLRWRTGSLAKVKSL